MEQHLSFLKTCAYYISKNINVLTIPSLFEYYSAYILSQELEKQFYVWKDLTPTQKEVCHFPNTDKGCDIAEESFNHIGQSKYYQNSVVTYGKLSTFLGFDKFSGQKHELHLIRSENSKLSEDIQGMIDRNTIHDHKLLEAGFQKFVNDVKTIGIPKLMRKKNLTLREPQIKALELINTSKKNVKIQIPTGVGKTVVCLTYIKERQDDHFLVLVPTIVLLEQWFNESVEMGIEKENIIMIGTGYTNDLDDVPDGSNDPQLVLCVYNSYESVREKNFDKIFVDEAHHVNTPMIYDDDQETEDNQSYISKIKEDVKNQQNFVMLSATLDQDEASDYYSYSIRDAIDTGYICDYQIVCPIFNDDPSDQNVVEYLIKKGLCHCIVYTSTIKKCKFLEDIFNSKLEGCCKSITSKTNKKNRVQILNDFNEGKFRFLINVKILSEGFNCRSAENCVFMHIPSNEVFAIQCIGRFLRLHPNKKIANVYFPFNHENDTRNISKFLKILVENDEKLKKEFYRKKLGTYFNIETIQELDVNGKIDKFKSKEIQFRYELIFNSLGVNLRIKMLLEFVELEKRPPKALEIYKTFKIGSFYNDLKKDKNKLLLGKIITQSQIIKDDYQKFLERKKSNISIERKCYSYLEFVEKNQRLPKFKITDKLSENFDYCQFYSLLKQGIHSFLFETILLKNEIIRKDYESFLEKKNNKIRIETQKKYFLLEKFLNEENRVPKQGDVINLFNVGLFYIELRKNDKKSKLFQDIISKYSIVKIDLDNYSNSKNIKKKFKNIKNVDKYNILLKFLNEFNRVPEKDEIYEDFPVHKFYTNVKITNGRIFRNIVSKMKFVKDDFENYKNKKNPKSLSRNQKINLLIEYVNTYNKIPLPKDIINNFKIGIYYYNLKSKTKKLPKKLSLISIINEDFNKYVLSKEVKHKTTPEQKAYLLLEYVSINKTLPTPSIVFKGEKIGSFYYSIKRGVNKEVFQKLLIKNEMIKKDIYKSLQDYKEKPLTIRVSKYKKKELILEFININNRVPKEKDCVGNINVGDFYLRLRYGRNKDILDQLIIESELVKEDFTKRGLIK